MIFGSTKIYGTKGKLMASIFTPELERQLKVSVRTAMRCGGGILAFRPEILPAGGTEWTGLRDYTTGDDPHRIDWGICARHDELRVRVYAGTARRKAYLLLDTSFGMSFRPTKLLAAKRAAAVLAAGILESGASLEFGAFTPDLTLFPILTHPQKCGRFLRFLEETPFSETPNLVNFEFTAHAFLSQNRKPGELYILSDCFGESDSFSKDFEIGLNRLQRAGFSCRLIHLTDPTDRAENFVGDVDICDESRGYRQTITLTERDLAVYQRLYDAYIADVQKYCMDRAIPYARIAADSPMEILCFTALGLSEKAARANPWAEYI